MKNPKEIADGYLDKYSKLVGLANTVMATALIVLLSNWIFIVEANYSAYTESKKDYKYNIQSIDSALTEVSKRYSTDTTKYKEEKKVLVSQKEEAKKEKNNSLKEELRDIEDWPSLIKFIFFVSDNLEKGALVLSGLFLLLVIYLFFTRRIALSYVSKALRIYKIEPQLRINKYKDFNLPTPLWIVPLPSKQNQKITPDELKTILGFTFNHSLLKISLFFILLFLFIIQLRLAFITIILNGSQFNTVSTANIIIMLATLLVSIYWLLPIKIEDNFNYEKNPNSLTRNDFIALSIFGATSAAFYWVAPFLPQYLYRKKPRFIAKKEKLDFVFLKYRGNLVINQKSQIVHFIDRNGRARSIKSFNGYSDATIFLKHIGLFSSIATLKTKGKPRMPKGRSLDAESFALEKIQISDFDLASKMLLYAIKQNVENFTPMYRLHDLLALVCIKHSDKLPKHIWQDLIDISNNSKDKKLINRVKKWTSTEWKTKITNENISFDNIKI